MQRFAAVVAPVQRDLEEHRRRLAAAGAAYLASPIYPSTGRVVLHDTSPEARELFDRAAEALHPVYRAVQGWLDGMPVQRYFQMDGFRRRSGWPVPASREEGTPPPPEAYIVGWADNSNNSWREYVPAEAAGDVPPEVRVAVDAARGREIGGYCRADLVEALVHRAVITPAVPA